MKTPILVTGSHRSGTTWVGRMLAATGEAGYIHEPFNPLRRPGWAGDRIPYWYLYVCADNAGYYEEVVGDVLRFRYPALRNVAELRSPKSFALYAQDVAAAARYRVTSPRPLLKDPIALFSAPWLADRFGARVVVMIRHPAAFVSSIKKLDWRFRFRSWLAQDLLLRDLLGDLEPEMRRAGASDDVIEQGIVMWKGIHRAIDRYRRDHPGWSFVRHEDISLDPVAGFRELYGRMGLAWTEKARRAVVRSTDAANPGEVGTLRHGSTKRDSRAAARVWRSRLSKEEIDRVRRGVGEVSDLFYSDDEWELATSS